MASMQGARASSIVLASPRYGRMSCHSYRHSKLKCSPPSFIVESRPSTRSATNLRFRASIGPKDGNTILSDCIPGSVETVTEYKSVSTSKKSDLSVARGQNDFRIGFRHFSTALLAVVPFLFGGRYEAQALSALSGVQPWLQDSPPALLFTSQLPLISLADAEFQNGFLSSFLLIIFSEIGDKTFFIAALLASRQSNFAVFTGTFGALAVMSVISVSLGRVFHYVDEAYPIMLANGDLPLDDIAAVVLLLYFGVTTLLDASTMDGSKAQEEQQEAEIAVASVESKASSSSNSAATILSVFVLVFLAEWGDKSFFSTIALAASSSPLGVVSGAIAGHGLATVLAVLGGSFLGSFISEKVLAYGGGSLFLLFAAITSADIWNKLHS